MKNLTLVIPTKHEKYSLPKVLKELKKFNLKILVIIENSDIETFNAIKSFNIEIIYQSGKGYGDAIIEGINNVKTEYLCIFNADGSFDPKYLKQMLNVCQNNFDFVGAGKNLSEAQKVFRKNIKGKRILFISIKVINPEH